jgi:predicted NBD/HSP70 family sugar kinase
MPEDDDIGAGDVTRMAVLALLGRQGPASRAVIARELDVSAGLVSQVTRRLIQQGVVEPLYNAPSEGGRPGQLLGLVAGAGRAVGVKLAADHLVMVDAQLDGQVVRSETEPFDALDKGSVDELASKLKQFIADDNKRLLGVGVCVPGVVAEPDVGIVDADVLGWEQVPLGDYLRSALGTPVLIENDVKAFAVAEFLYGRGKDRANFVVVTIGRGVGFASVAGGVLQRGCGGGAGELAHVVISNNGPSCACGQRGCLEAYVGASGLVLAGIATGALSAGDDFARLAELADTGSRSAREIFARAGQRLAHAVAPAIAALNPEVVLIAGEGTQWWHHWDSAFRASLRKRLPRWMGETPVEVDRWEDPSWARGAAAIVLATPFDRNAHAGRQRHQVLARLHGRSA